MAKKETELVFKGRDFDELNRIYSSDFINDKVVRTHTKKSYLNDVHLGS